MNVMPPHAVRFFRRAARAGQRGHGIALGRNHSPGVPPRLPVVVEAVLTLPAHVGRHPCCWPLGTVESRGDAAPAWTRRTPRRQGPPGPRRDGAVGRGVGRRQLGGEHRAGTTWPTTRRTTSQGGSPKLRRREERSPAVMRRGPQRSDPALPSARASPSDAHPRPLTLLSWPPGASVVRQLDFRGRIGTRGAGGSATIRN